MFELRKFVAPEIVFGAGALDLAGRYARNFGARKVLVVTDPGVMTAGWAERVISSLEKGDVKSATFSDITPNPRAEEVMAGVECYQTNRCDVIVAVGGGSTMDCAKGIGTVATNHRHILQFEGIDRIPMPGPPLICIPTTAGTSADISQFAIITDTQERVKKAIISKTAVPDVALVDPRTTTTMDNYLTACTAIDALVHGIESYVSTANSPIFDLHSREAIRIIMTKLQAVMAAPQDLELRSRLMFASLEAGLAFSNASLGAVHAMAHSLGGYLDLAHGECNAMLLDHVVAYNFPAASQRYADIGAIMGIETRKMRQQEIRKAILAEIVRLKHAVGITGTLKARGIKTADIPQLAKKAIVDPCMVTNPRAPVQRDIEVVYEEAL